jgi:hypothetical protein
VVELNMSHFGQMQLDGLYRRESGSKQFDLFVRTKEPLTDDVKQDIRSIFTASTEAAGLKGAVQFQVAREFPISPIDEEPSAPHGSSGSIVA